MKPSVAKPLILTPDEILNVVRRVVAQTYCLDLDSIGPATKFYQDVDGDSVEWLDLSFRLEKVFQVRLPGGNEFHAETDAEGRLTPEGLEQLRASFPEHFLDRVRDRIPDPTARDIAIEITVQDIADMVANALTARSAREPA